MLIDEHKSVGVFHQNIKFVENADDLELLLNRSGTGSVLRQIFLGRYGHFLPTTYWGLHGLLAAQRKLALQLAELSPRDGGGNFRARGGPPYSRRNHCR